MTSHRTDDSLVAYDRAFLSKAGLVTLLMGIALFAVGAFLDHPTAGAIAFAFCVVVSTSLSAFAGNDRISTATLVIDILLLVTMGFNLLFYYML